MLTDADLAELYDLQYPWTGPHPSHPYYLEQVMAADSVLDVGCGTGSMLHVARDAGHRGRLAGLDPDPAMLDRARRRTDVEWVLGRAEDARWDREFELATMLSHAFQCLLGDDELRRSLAAIRAALRDGGRFAFETRHPQARAWLDWVPANAAEVTDATGRRLRVSHHVDSVDADLVTFTETTGLAAGTVLRADRATLRFLDVPALNEFLTGAGFAVEAQYGDWDRGPVTGTSREIITIARRV